MRPVCKLPRSEEEVASNTLFKEIRTLWTAMILFNYRHISYLPVASRPQFI